MIKINIEDYKEDNSNLKTFYGLNKDIIFCNSCTYSNQKPLSELEFSHNFKTKKSTLNLGEENICSACKIAERKKEIDWHEREKKLIELCDKYRSKDGNYDCIIPGSGGKDSFYVSYMLKYKYNMNPLTITWAPHIYTSWGWQNFQSWIHSGLDNFLFTPNGRVHRLLTRLALENIFHPFQPFIMGQNHFPIRAAAKYFNIKLVFYGDTNAEFGNKDDFDNPSKPDKYFTTKSNDNSIISGVNISELKEKYKIKSQDLTPYLPITNDEYVKSEINVQYLGYYLKWHPQECYYFAVEKGNFVPSPERTTGTYSKYSSIDDKMDDLHYYTTFIKFGIGRATYDAAQEIRNGEITREEGIRLVKQFDGEYPERFEKEVFEYLSIDKKHFSEIFDKFKNPIMTKDYFLELCNKFRSPHIWKFKGNKWILRKKIY